MVEPWTPGPWTLDPEWDSDTIAVIADRGEPFAYLGLESFADATLIALAPEMADLLRRLEEWDHLEGSADGPYWHGLISDLLARARGGGSKV